MKKLQKQKTQKTEKRKVSFFYKLNNCGSLSKQSQSDRSDAIESTHLHGYVNINSCPDLCIPLSVYYYKVQQNLCSKMKSKHTLLVILHMYLPLENEISDLFWHYDPNSSIRMRKEKITLLVIWSNQLNDIAYLANSAEFYCKYQLSPQIDIYGSSFFLFPSFMDTFRAKCYKSRKFMFMWHLKL